MYGWLIVDIVRRKTQDKFQMHPCLSTQLHNSFHLQRISFILHTTRMYINHIIEINKMKPQM
jgi:hypothetical protein